MAINVKDKLVTVESLGIAYSAEQDAREEADQALSTRIDNIVAPEGDPSLAEVADARTSGSTTYNTLKARLDADKESIGTDISGIKADLKSTFGYRGRNIKSKITESGRITSNGTDNASASFVRSIYIPVSKDDIITYYNLRTGSEYNVISFYTSDSSSTYVSGIKGQGAGTLLSGAFICPNNGYVRISTRISDLNLVYVSIDSDRVLSTEIVKYVSASGSDSNTGDTPASPYATVAKAISEFADVIHIAAGTYTETVYNIYKNTKLIGENGTVFSFSTITTNAIEFREAVVEIENITVDMTGCTGSYSGIYVRNCIATLKNCTVKNAPYMGFLLNGSRAFLESCTATGSTIDGFNAHDTPSYASEGTFINCVAIGNGDDGLSYHETGVMHVLGGEYAGNTSTGIAPHNDCNCDIVGAYIHDNGRAGIEALLGNYTIPDPLPTMILNGCMLEANTGNAVTAEHYTVKASSNGLSGNGTDSIVDSGGSTIAMFDGGGGGSSTLSGLTDTNISGQTDGQVLTYDGTSSKWVNRTPSGGGSITVDSALSSKSTNPVQNKVIKQALDDKAGTAEATTSANGLMSSTDKSHLDAVYADYTAMLALI